MKALLKSGVFLALGWLAHHADAQETKWHASTPQKANPIVASPQAASNDGGVRGVSLSQPVPLDAKPGVVRAQMPEPMILQPLPKIETNDQKPPLTIEVQKPFIIESTKPMPKGGGGVSQKVPDNGGAKTLQPKDLPPKDWSAPSPEQVPSPIFDSIGYGGCDDGCGATCMDGCGVPGWGRRARYLGNNCCPPRPMAWISAEYLMWFQKGQQTPPLVSSSPAGTPFNNIGVLPGATVLYDHVPDHVLSGGRFSGGFWFNHFPNLGIDASFFFLGQVNTSQIFTSDGTNYLGRPFTNLNPTLNASEPFSTPTRMGYAKIDTYSQLWGADIDLRYKWWCGPNCWIDLLAGYKTLTLREGINITEDFTFLAGDPSGAAAGTRSIEQESFTTRNIFHGGQIGFDSQWRFAPRWSLGATSKVAFGVMTEIVTITGTTTTIGPTGQVLNQQGALLALQGTNIGRYQQNRYAVVPEFGLRLNYNITDNLSVFFAYNFIYVSSVVRPGDQIDPFVNQAFRPNGNGTGPTRPAVLFQTTDYWAQGMSVGMRYQW